MIRSFFTISLFAIAAATPQEALPSTCFSLLKPHEAFEFAVSDTIAAARFSSAETLERIKKRVETAKGPRDLIESLRMLEPFMPENKESTLSKLQEAHAALFAGATDDATLSLLQEAKQAAAFHLHWAANAKSNGLRRRHLDETEGHLAEILPLKNAAPSKTGIVAKIAPHSINGLTIARSRLLFMAGRPPSSTVFGLSEGESDASPHEAEGILKIAASPRSELYFGAQEMQGIEKQYHILTLSAKNGEFAESLDFLAHPPTELRLSATGKTLLYGSTEDGLTIFQDLFGQHKKRRFVPPAGKADPPVRCSAISNDDKRIAVVRGNGIEIYDLAKQARPVQRHEPIPLPPRFEKKTLVLSFSNDDDALLLNTSTNLFILQLTDGILFKKTYPLQQPPKDSAVSRVYGLAQFSPDDRYIVAATGTHESRNYNQIAVWDGHSGRFLRLWRAHGNAIAGLAFVEPLDAAEPERPLVSVDSGGFLRTWLLSKQLTDGEGL